MLVKKLHEKYMITNHYTAFYLLPTDGNMERKLGGCRPIAWNAHNTVFDSKCSAICAQAV